MNEIHEKTIMPSEKMIDVITYSIESTRPIEEIVQELPSACEIHKFSLLQTYVYHEIVASKGFPINRKAYVFEICQAKTAAAMLTYYPKFSLLMPCRISIYEENNQVVISTMNMNIMLEDVVSTPELYNETKLLFETVKALINSIYTV